MDNTKANLRNNPIFHDLFQDAKIKILWEKPVARSRKLEQPKLLMKLTDRETIDKLFLNKQSAFNEVMFNFSFLQRRAITNPLILGPGPLYCFNNPHMRKIICSYYFQFPLKTWRVICVLDLKTRIRSQIHH